MERLCNRPKVLGYKETGERLPLYPNLKNTTLSVATTRQVENGEVLPLHNQQGVDDDQDLAKYPRPTDIVTRQ